MKINIGDQVSFISEKLEGKVTGIIDNGHVNVYCDEYGFEIPASTDDLLVLQSIYGGREREEQEGTAAKAISAERSDRVSIALAPSDYNNLQDSTFDLFVVNDTGKTVIYTLAVSGGGSYTGLSAGNIDPGKRVEIGTYTAKDIDERLKSIKFQALFFMKRDEKWFSPISKEWKISMATLFKSGAYKQNRFFETPVYSRYTDESEHLEIVPVPKERTKVKDLSSDGELIRELNAKIKKDTKSGTSIRQKEEPVSKNILEIDLHAEALLETTAGMDSGAILEYQIDTFKNTMEKYKLRRGQKIVFIHGKGDGVLRQRILWLLQTTYKRHNHQDASFKQYGFGATMVTIR